MKKLIISLRNKYSLLLSAMLDDTDRARINYIKNIKKRKQEIDLDIQRYDKIKAVARELTKDNIKFI